MPSLFTESQFDRLMESYELVRQKHLAEQERRTQEVYRLIPRYRELDEIVPDLSLRVSKELFSGKSSGLDAYREQMAAIAKERKELLRSHDLPEDYLDLQYDCPLCRDTGYTEDDRCTCLKQKIRDILYEQSNLSALFRENCFERMELSYFEGEDLRRFTRAVQVCRDFIDGFGKDNASSGILFFGPVGSGKSFLSIACAKELLNRGFSVLYFSAIDLFARLSDATFHAEEHPESLSFAEDLMNCDLLIIDDLGTEMTNLFVSSRLFHLINTRHLKEHATLISTNLDFEEISVRYSDRVFSRLLSLYSVCELTGGDIRLKRKTTQ